LFVEEIEKRRRSTTTRRGRGGRKIDRGAGKKGKKKPRGNNNF